MSEMRNKVREWILSHSKSVSAEELQDDTPLIKGRIITSLQVMDLVLFIESLRKDSIDTAKLKPESFRDINSLCAVFFNE